MSKEIYGLERAAVLCQISYFKITANAANKI
jgi:hypothetical protein